MQICLKNNILICFLAVKPSEQKFFYYAAPARQFHLWNNKFLYRGQAKFYSPCKPSIFRDLKKDYFIDDMIQINEMEVLLRDHPLVKLFEQGFMLMNEFIQFKINYMGLSRHYYNYTHLLDMTSDMDVAKFFAVTTFDMDNDCYLEYKGDELGVLYYYDIKADAFNINKGRVHHVDTIGKQPFMRSGNQSGFVSVSAVTYCSL